MRHLGWLAIGLFACGGGMGGGGDDDDDGVTLVGECDPAADSAAVTTTVIDLFDEGQCLADPFTGLVVVESAAEWDALFSCGDPPAVPAELDFATQRAAIVHVNCQPLDFRFAAEGPSEIVVGVLARVSGACIANLLVVPLPQSDKPVRVAECRVDCGDCPPVP
jgi:hypothetical protein